jgi:glycine oxidase
VAAGIINPITGQRIVKSWRVETLLPLASETYHALEQQLGVSLWRDLRVRRLYLNESERRILAEKQARGELADYVRGHDGEGFWIEGAARVDVALMINAARARWLSAGVLQERRVDLHRARDQHELIIDCTGKDHRSFDFVDWQYSKGETLTVAIEGLRPDVVLNRGQWLLPVSHGRAKFGATQGPGQRDLTITTAARMSLEAALRAMTSDPFAVTDQQAGVRVYVGDKRPVVGRHPGGSRLGLMNGLGAKGVLFAPGLARQWVNHLRDGVPFDREVDVGRLARDPKRTAVLSQ